jgi:hypothetical protein
MLKEITYPVAIRALEKWKNNFLELVHRSEGATHFCFLYNGSTCNNGGTPYKAYFHAILNSSEFDPHVSKAWIEIPEDEIENVSEMCGFKKEGDRFLRKLSGFENLEGRAVSDILADEPELNHAGCFCKEAMLNQKWRMALSTMYYALDKESR